MQVYDFVPSPSPSTFAILSFYSDPRVQPYGIQSFWLKDRFLIEVGWVGSWGTNGIWGFIYFHKLLTMSMRHVFNLGCATAGHSIFLWLSTENLNTSIGLLMWQFIWRASWGFACFFLLFLTFFFLSLILFVKEQKVFEHKKWQASHIQPWAFSSSAWFGAYIQISF